MSSWRTGIFVATMTGTAEICADEIRDALRSAGIAATPKLMKDLAADALDDLDLIIIVSSTYGLGDIPDNGQAFYQAIEAGRSLTHKRYAVFGLGDMSYAATFCAAGKMWDALFESKGAQRICELKQHDASDGTLAEDVAGVWASALCQSFLAAA